MHVRVSGLRFESFSQMGIMLRDNFVRVGGLIFIIFVGMAVIAPYATPFAPKQVIIIEGQFKANQQPSPLFLLGTTNYGRDIFTGVLYGAQAALFVGLTAALLVSAIGTVAGVVAGYYGGKLDTVTMRIADISFAIPFLPFIIVLVSFMGASTINIVLAVSALLWANPARVIRSQVLSIKERAYIESAVVIGASRRRIAFIHIMPNVLPLTFLYGSFAVGWSILAEASISFLGFGDANLVSWGRLLQEAYLALAVSRGFWWWFIPPGLCITALVLSVYFIGRGIENVLFPKQRETW